MLIERIAHDYLVDIISHRSPPPKIVQVGVGRHQQVFEGDEKVSEGYDEFCGTVFHLENKFEWVSAEHDQFSSATNNLSRAAMSSPRTAPRRNAPSPSIRPPIGLFAQ
jgi:hypothetical protein